MSEMIERAARAIYDCPGSDMLANTGDAFPKPTWEDAHPAIRDDCRAHARAVFKAIREPTDEVCLAAEGGDIFDARIPWVQMIDAILRRD